MKKLTSTQEAILNYINEKDPRHEIVTIDTEGESITFCPEIYPHQNPKYEPEGFVRAYLIVHLICDLGYNKENIEIENDISVNVGRTKKNRSGKAGGRSDILVFNKEKDADGHEKLFMGIECKTFEEFKSALEDIDGQLWGITKSSEIERRVRFIQYLCLYTCQAHKGIIKEKSLVIDYQKNKTVKIWEDNKKKADNVIPSNYGETYSYVYANIPYPDNGKLPLEKNYSENDFAKLRSELHDLLWAGSTMNDNDIFYQLVKIFLVKIYDERFTNPGNEYSVQIRKINGEEEADNKLLSRIEEKYNTACKELLNYDEKKIKEECKFFSEGFTPQKLHAVIEKIEGISLTENESTKKGFDILGNFFEKILNNQDFYKQSKGCFFTHANIVKFMIAMLQVDELAIQLLQSNNARLPYIIDPSCGSGTFLIEVMRYLTWSVNKKQKPSNLNANGKEVFNAAFKQLGKPNAWAGDYLYGIEPKSDLGLASKVNMILHGDGNMNIFIEDGLHPFSYERYDRRWKGKDIGLLKTYEKSRVYNDKFVNGNFDVIITNPPFSVKPDGLPSFTTHKDTFLYSDKKNSENLFIERHYQLLREGGKLAAVLPESVFDTSENKYIRLFIFKFFHVDAIVSLPQDAFSPYTSTKTSILFATKKTTEEVKAYDECWNRAAKIYSKIRKEKVILAVLNNQKIVDRFSKLAKKFEYMFKFDENIVINSKHNKAVIKGLERIILGLPEGTKKEKSDKSKLMSEIDQIKEVISKNSFAEYENDDCRCVILKLLRITSDEKKIKVYDIINKLYEDILDATELDYPDYGDSQKYTNSWWCFSEVTQNDKFNDNVFFAEAHNIGYKRTKRGETQMPNDLYSVGNNGDYPEVNIKTPKTILDNYIKYIKESK
ncbi:MAG: N-6 DNA methylase [Alphaproteobacteria bacterium]|nr:N-6 DNA methylase [Alphaproteobacteria bacterium]